MQRRPPIKIKIVDFTGDLRTWTIVFKTLGTKTKTVYGECDWNTQTIYISTRLRNTLTIALTLCHEIDHVTAGPNIGEPLVKQCDDNRRVAIKKVFGI